ncbi:MAG: VCBS repeat-containing protein [Acidobacteria bacterium]|nr:VCBS repeat-containing protein [Acidobacteriota bacterium]
MANRIWLCRISPRTNVKHISEQWLGRFGTAINIAVGDGPTAIASANFNGDSNYDLVSVNYLANTVSYLPGITGGGFASPTNYAVGTNPRNISVADFNGDGKPDLAVANWTSNNVSGVDQRTWRRVHCRPDTSSVGTRLWELQR